MFAVPTVLWLLVVACFSRAQHVDHPDGSSDRFHTQDENGNFNFGYNTVRADGSRDSRTERGDAYGNVVGSYSLLDTDGRSRTVEYTAGEDGFQAVVRTNEPGTANQSPAFVSINAEPPRGTQVVGRPPAAVNPPPTTTVRRPYRPVYRPRPTQYQHYDPYNHHGSDYGHHSHSHYRYDYPQYY